MKDVRVEKPGEGVVLMPGRVRNAAPSPFVDLAGRYVSWPRKADWSHTVQQAEANDDRAGVHPDEDAEEHEAVDKEVENRTAIA